MLSYMVPSIEEKPPPIPNKGHLQLELEGHQRPELQAPPLTNGHPKRIIKTQSKSSTISAESSASSVSSVVSEVAATHTATPAQDKPLKQTPNGHTKHPTLKRCQGPTKGDGSKAQDNNLTKKVSFGSSKGSMVETLIYESPLQEEPEPNPSADQSSIASTPGSESGKASKVRVTFFECEKPLVVSSPEPCEESDALDASGLTMTAVASPVYQHEPVDQTPMYNRQASTDSGWDNPFRPDGDLSREADEIVELIKGGKPITPTPGTPPHANHNGDLGQQPEEAATTAAATEQEAKKQQTQPLLNAQPQQPPAKDSNGTAVTNGAQVEPQRGTLIAPNDPSQVEHVTLKKKPKCKCCVIQ